MKAGWRPGWAWASVGLLAALCGGLAVLQYRWIGEIGSAERQRLHEDLLQRLDTLRRDFNQSISATFEALQPSTEDVGTLGWEQAYSSQYQQWKGSYEPLFRRIAVVIPERDKLHFYNLNLQTAAFVMEPWPSTWSGLESRLLERRRGERVPPDAGANWPILLQSPRFGGAAGWPPHEQEWLVAELDLDYFRSNVLPGMVGRHLGTGGKIDFDVEVTSGTARPAVLYESSPGAVNRIADRADASIRLLDRVSARPPGGGVPGGFPPEIRPLDARGEPFGRGGFPGPPGAGPGLWLLRVRHRAGSLEALVAQARLRNLTVSSGLLLLLLATVGVLVRYSRRTQKLAELQINFVAGVSHELRTPLTVIRTAAFNLQHRLAHQPEQVESYGSLIRQESEKLGALVEQILRFASAKAGHIIRRQEPLAVKQLIEECRPTSQEGCGGGQVILETRVEPGLPRVFADAAALKHALQNLVDNAIKYATARDPWVGIFARSADGGNGPAIEIAVVDRGPGIPLDEQAHIFDPFFRGRRAIEDQVHGTGLGLDLVKRIVEAHGGSIRVESKSGHGTAFVLRLPAASPELDHELAHSFH